MDRREFLKTMVLTTGVPVAHFLAPQPSYAAAAKQQQFRVGHNTTTHLHYERSTASFWKGVEELASLGFRGTEADDMIARLTDTYANRVSEFRQRMAKYRMEMPALYHSLPVNDASRVKDSIAEGVRVGKFIHDIGGNIFNLAGGTRVPGGNPTEDFLTLARLVNDLGERLRDEYGVRLGYHPHMGNMIQGREEIARMMDMTRPQYFSLCPDAGHLAFAGCDVLEVFRTYRSRIIYMHYKDFDPNLQTPRTAHTGRRGGFVELGQGVIDFPALTKFLIESDYPGWVMIELDPTRTTPLDSAGKNLEYINNRLKLKVA